MSVLDKKLYLSCLEEKLNAYIPANEVRKIIESAADVLGAYDMTAVPTEQGSNDESVGMIKLFLDAKTVEGRSPQTISQYSYVLSSMCKGVGVPLTKVTVHHLRTWLMTEKDRGISLRTLEGYRYVMTSFFGWLNKEEILAKDPTANLRPIKYMKVIPKPFSQDELERMREAARTTREKAILAVLLSTGCRISEVCQLDVLDIDMQARAVTVLGKGSKQRKVYLDDVAILYLRRYFKERNDSSPALFVGKGSARLTPDGVRYILRQIEEHSGVEHVHPHRFRRTLATNLISHGMAIQEVAAILGHDKIDTTMTYVYIDQRAVENAYRKFA